MKLLIVFLITLLFGIAATAPTRSGRDDKRNHKLYSESNVIYKGNHDIVSISVPVTVISPEDTSVMLFFVEADVDLEGKLNYQGLYVFKNNKATKLLDNGRDTATSFDETKHVYFAAQDGIYAYKPDTNEAVKYGSVNDSIICIEKLKSSNVLYILTEDHELYKVTDAGNTKSKVHDVVNAQEIVLDYSDNIYFYAEDKKPYVVTATGLKNIEGLPPNPTKVKLIKPPLLIQDGVPFMVDTASYLIFANGSSKFIMDVSPEMQPTALALEALLIQYYGHDKKIYEFNILAIIFEDLLQSLSEYLDKKINSLMLPASSKK